jgi:hypothetical protein
MYDVHQATLQTSASCERSALARDGYIGHGKWLHWLVQAPRDFRSTVVMLAKVYAFAIGCIRS